MAASILHFGQEHNNRLPHLRNAGFSVRHFDNILDFRRALQYGVEHDAVSLSEQDEGMARLAILAARTYSSAPLVLFHKATVIPFRACERERAGAQEKLKADFDLVVPANAMPHRWVADIWALILRSGELRNRPERVPERTFLLHRQTAEEIEKTRFQIERSILERARNTPRGTEAKPHVDRMLKCTGCGTEFVFTAGEQNYFQARKLLLNDPRHCKNCRSIRRGGIAWHHQRQM